MLTRLRSLFQRKPDLCPGGQLYAELLQPETLARALAICQLPDDLTGRFAALAFSAALKLQGREDRAAVERELVGAMVADIDVAFREHSLGDASVKKHATNHAAALYGRLRAYERALSGAEPMDTVLARNLYSAAPTVDQAEALPTLLPRMQDLLGTCA